VSHVVVVNLGGRGIADSLDRNYRRKHHRRIARLIFTTIDGRPIHRGTWAQIWAPAARNAGIPKGTGLHSLRHYFATLPVSTAAQASSEYSSLSATPHPRSPSNTYVGGVAGHRPADSHNR